MSKWIWLGLFVLTLFGTVWLGTRPKSQKTEATASKSEAPVVAEDSYQMVVPKVSQIPMSPEHIQPNQPTPFTDVPPDYATPEHPDYVPPPLSDGEIEPQLDSNNPPPQQSYPSNPPITEDGQYFNNGEVLPEYLRPPPGSAVPPLDGGDGDGQPDQGPVDEGY